MKETYIKTINLPDIVSKQFKNKDLITIDDLVNCLLEKCMDISRLEERLEARNYTNEDSAARILEENIALRYKLQQMKKDQGSDSK